MIITSAVKQKNNPDMLRIYIDGVYAFSMPEEEYLKMNLYEQRELNQGEIDSIRQEVNIRLAKQRAVRMLSTRDRTAFEVKERIMQQGFDEEAAEGAILELKAMGYINDRLYARKYISDRLKLKPQSQKALAFELQRKGLEQDLISEVMDEFELDDVFIAYRIAKKKYGKYDVADPQIQRKIASFLAFRGFSHSTVKDVIQQLLEDNR